MTDKAMNDDSRYEKQVHCAEDDNDFFMLRKADVKKYGESEAIMLTVLRGWLRTNRAEGRNIRDGYVWTYNSARKWADELEFWNEDKVKRLLRELEKKGAIIVGNYNKMKSDRTKWYSMEGFKVTDAKGVSEQKNLAIGNNDNTHSAKTHNEEKQQLTIDQLVESRATPHCANLPDDSGNLPDHYQYINNNKKDLNNITSRMNSDESIPTSEDKNLPALAVKGKARKTKSDSEKLQSLFNAEPEAIGGIYTPSGSKWGSEGDLFVAQCLFEHCRSRYHKCKEPKWVDWANDIRLMRKRDNVTHEEMCSVIDYVTQHHFWRNVILSPKAMRASWIRLITQTRDWLKRNSLGGESWLNDKAAMQESLEFHDPKTAQMINDYLYPNTEKPVNQGGHSAPYAGEFIDADYNVIDDPF